MAPRTPLHVPPHSLIYNVPTQCDETVDVNQGAKCAMAAIEAMDTEIGRMLQALTQENRARTTIIFLGDNGSDLPYSDSKPFNNEETKTTVNEGGIRVPFFISGNNVLAKNKTSESLVSTVDVFQTVIDIMGGNSPNLDETDGYKIDSKSLVPIMLDPNVEIRDFAFSELKRPVGECIPSTDQTPGSSASYGDAYVTQRYKLLLRVDYDEVENIIELPSLLYDLIEDPFEDNNLLNEDGTAPSHEIQLLLNSLNNARNELLASE